MGANWAAEPAAKSFFEESAFFTATGEATGGEATGGEATFFTAATQDRLGGDESPESKSAMSSVSNKKTIDAVF
jgi:hypothetical protein